MASRKELEALVQDESIKKQMKQQASVRLKNDEDAEDTIQESIRILLDRPDEDMVRIYNPGGFFWVIFERTLIRNEEKNKKRKSLPVDENIPMSIYEPIFTRVELERLINSEKRNKREILILHFKEGFNSVQIAKSVKKSETYVKKIIIGFTKKLVNINGKK